MTAGREIREGKIVRQRERSAGRNGGSTRGCLTWQASPEARVASWTSFVLKEKICSLHRSNEKILNRIFTQNCQLYTDADGVTGSWCRIAPFCTALITRDRSIRRYL
jgi:hypothetical protein